MVESPVRRVIVKSQIIFCKYNLVEPFWSTYLVESLDDGSLNVVYSDVWLINAARLCVAAWLTLVRGLNVDGRRSGSHDKVEGLHT